jgi:hypothetical protein
MAEEKIGRREERTTLLSCPVGSGTETTHISFAGEDM